MATSLTNQKSSRPVTEYIRGIAILIVVFSHYLSVYQAGLYQRHFAEIASMALAVFFVVSGYGIVQSLERRFSKGTPAGKVLAGFYFDRAFRIFLPYWIMLSILLLIPQSRVLPVIPWGNEISGGFDSHLFLVYSGIDAFEWFVNSILQCYLVAPLLYLIYRKAGAARFAAGLVIVGALLMTLSQYAVSLGITNKKVVSIFLYREMFLANIILFAFGMLIPAIVSRYRSRVDNAPAILAALAAFALSIYYGRTGLALIPVFIVSCFALCTFLIARSPVLPLARIINIFGRNSYPLFLFHRTFFILLGALGILSVGKKAGLIYFALLLPLLLLFCAGLDWAVNRGHEILTRRRGPIEQPLQTPVAEAEQLSL